MAPICAVNRTNVMMKKQDFFGVNGLYTLVTANSDVGFNSG